MQRSFHATRSRFLLYVAAFLKFAAACRLISKTNVVCFCRACLMCIQYNQFHYFVRSSTIYVNHMLVLKVRSYMTGRMSKYFVAKGSNGTICSWLAWLDKSRCCACEEAVGMATLGIIRLAAQELQAWKHRTCTCSCTDATYGCYVSISMAEHKPLYNPSMKPT